MLSENMGMLQEEILLFVPQTKIKPVTVMLATFIIIYFNQISINYQLFLHADNC